MGAGKDIRKPRVTDRTSEQHDAHLEGLTELSSDWYWEQDEHFRFTWMSGGALKRSGIDPKNFLGACRWEQGAAPVGNDNTWGQHRAVLKAHQPFTDFLYKRVNAQGEPLYILTSGRPMFDDQGRFTGYRGIARDVTERIQIELRLTIEHAVTRVLAESNNIAEASPQIIRVICDHLQWACGARWEFDEKNDAIRCVDNWGVATAAIDEFLDYSRQLPLSTDPGGLIRRTWAAAQPVWIPDVTKDASFRRADNARKAGLHSAFAFPVQTASQVIGVMEFFSREIQQPDAELLKCMTYISSQIGQFCQRTQAEERLREIGERFQHLSELSSDWFWEQDEHYRFTRRAGGTQNSAWLLLDNDFGKTRWELPYLDVSPEQWAAHKATLDARLPFYDLVLKRKDKDGCIRHVSLSGRPYFDDNGNFKGYRGIGKDVTERKLAEERIQYLATHDGLTALPNRTMFSQMLNFALQHARRYNRHFAVLFIDLDRFKIINDTLGHDAGDKLLQEMGARLTGAVRSSDVVARLGGDEFVVLVQEVPEARYVATVARKILSTLIKPVTIQGQECRVTASIGICMYPADAQSENALMKNADIAMYRAKEAGKNTYQFYAEAMNVHSFERLALETSLRRALERSEFFVHYQAKLDFKSGRISGVEALVRWQHPDLGLIAPAQFIPLAEETGLILPIGKWVLNTACAQNVAWQRAGLPPLCMAVNLSARQFADNDLVQDIAAALKNSGMDPDLLELELTESMLMQNVERAGKVLAAIKQMGVRLAIDDFGVGYSSLAHLKRFPIDTLKVDHSFIRDLPQDTEDKAITEAIIAMGKTLSISVVAEGVETQEQAAFLREHACDAMQGYYFSRPITGDAFAELLRQHLISNSPPTSIINIDN